MEAVLVCPICGARHGCNLIQGERLLFCNKCYLPRNYVHCCSPITDGFEKDQEEICDKCKKEMQNESGLDERKTVGK